MPWLHSKAVFPNADDTSGHGRIVVDPFGINIPGRSNVDGYLYPDSSYTSYATNGFGRNELAYAAIMYKARNLPQGVLRVYTPNMVEPLDDHRLRKLIEQPNPATNEVEFLQLSVVYLDLAGNNYWLIIRGRDGLPAELWPLRPDMVRIIPNPRDARFWDYGVVYEPSPVTGGQVQRIIPVDRRDIVHTKWPNPLDRYFGQAPMRAATRAVSVDNTRTDYVDALLRNDAVPRTVITTESEINQALVDRLEARWGRKYGGTNRGKPAFLQAGMKVETLGLNLDQLQFGDLSSIEESRITMAFGVQPVLIGAKVGLDRSTFANFGEAKAHFWEDMGMSLQDMFRAAFCAQVVPEFNGVGRRPVYVKWDNSEVLALQEAESSKWERATNALARGGVTINDFRRTVGLDPVPGGDVFLIPAGVVPTPAGGELQPPAAPAAPAPDATQGPGQDGQDTTQQAPPDLQAASYAERFLHELPRPRHNGRQPSRVGG